MGTFALQTGELKLLATEIQSDGIPTAMMGGYTTLVGSVPVCQSIIQTRQLSALSKRHFSFSIEEVATLCGMTSGNDAAPQTRYLRAGINANAAVEIVVVSQGNAYDGTTLTRGDYTLVCVPQVDLPPAENIYFEPWGGDGPPPTPGGGFQRDINGVFAAGDAVILSSTVQDAHTGSGNWSSTLETVIPISGANAAALVALRARAVKWAYRQGAWSTTSPKSPIRTYITARAPYLSGGAGCSLDILGAYVRAVY